MKIYHFRRLNYARCKNVVIVLVLFIISYSYLSRCPGVDLAPLSPPIRGSSSHQPKSPPLWC